MEFNEFISTLKNYYPHEVTIAEFTRRVLANAVTEDMSYEFLHEGDDSTFGKAAGKKRGNISQGMAKKVLPNQSRKRFLSFIDGFELTEDAVNRIKKRFGLDAKMKKQEIYNGLYDVLLDCLENAGTRKKTPNTAIELTKNEFADDRTLTSQHTLPIMPYSKADILNASREDYMDSRKPGSRFANLNILSHLLPHGYVITNLAGYGKTDEDIDCPLEFLLDKYAEQNIALIGEGGIGKTTFLLKIMERFHQSETQEHTPIPIFIELNRCPAKIGEWYSEKSNKTNFITRYIAAQSEMYALDNVHEAILKSIENEFRKPTQTPEYWLLLDGINEVSRSAAIDKNGNTTGSFIRDMLNTEIKALMTYPNVRVITASRKNELAFFTGDVKNIELTGVKQKDIVEHLRINGYQEPDINYILSQRKLVDCLRIPLFLCMFTISETGIEYPPLTRGEILNGFFNKKQSIYSQKGIMERIIGQSAFDRTLALFVIDFTLPHIGFFMESDGLFFMSRDEVIQAIDEFLSTTVIDDDIPTLWSKTVEVFPDYENATYTMNDLRTSLEKIGAESILDFIVNTLGIMYRGKNLEYSFIHHHIRDYFAGLHEIQRIKMAAAFYNSYISDDDTDALYKAYYSLSLAWGTIWNESKRVFVGEILSEHRNTPEVNAAGKWEIPAPIFPEQTLFRTVMDIFVNIDESSNRGMINIAGTMKAVRRNLAGVDFSGLDMRECRLHGIPLSVGRNENRLTALFTDAEISQETFEMEGHLEKILEFSYSYEGEYIFTISSDGTVKQWETDTGRCVNTIRLKKHDPNESDNLAQSFIVLSNGDDSFLTCAYSQDLAQNGVACNIHQHSWVDGEAECMEYRTTRPFNFLNTTSYSKRISKNGYSFGQTYVVAVFEDCHLHIYEQENPDAVVYTELDIMGSVIDAIMIGDHDVFLYYVSSQNINRDHEDEISGNAEFAIALHNLETKSTEILYTYLQYISVETEDELESALYPPFCVDNKCENMAFIEKGKIKIFSLRTKKVRHLPYSGDEPDFMTFANVSLLLVYTDRCVSYNIKTRQVEKVYQYGGLGFILHGNHSSQRLLLFDDDLNPYEWNLMNDEVKEKYKYSKRTLTGAYPIPQSTELMATYDNDSLVIIDRRNGELLEAICYNEPDARTSLALYSEAHNCMFFLYVNYFYEYIMCYDLNTSSYRRAYFDFVEERKIKALFLSDDETRLFCVFEKKVVEIEWQVQPMRYTDVYLASTDEVIHEAYFSGADNLVAIVLAFMPNEEASPKPKLPRLYEMEKTADGRYRLASWYQLPYVSKSVLKKLSSFSHTDYTQPIPHDVREKQGLMYYINAGIFLNFDDDVLNALRVDKHIMGADGRIETTVALSLKPHEVNYILGESPAVLAHYGFDSTQADSEEQQSKYPVVMLVRISKKDNTVIAIDDSRLAVFKYADGVYKKTGEATFEDAEIGIAGATVGGNDVIYYWSYTDKLYSYDVKSDAQTQYEYYIPGLVIKGCDFSGASMDESIKSMLIKHGGVV